MTAPELPEVILLDDISINVVRNPRRKRLSLEVGSTGVVAKAPERMRLSTIEKFVNSKSDWIKHYSENLPEPATPIELCNGAILKLLDEDIVLSLSLNKRGKGILSNSTLDLPVVQTKRPIEDSVKDKLVRWYKQQSLTCLRDKVAFYADEMEIDLPQTMNVKVRDYKRRWGSCDHKGDLSFNWRIIMSPEATIDYVVIHELAHLLEFNHSAKFWNIVSKQMPEWKTHQGWLHENGALLYRL